MRPLLLRAALAMVCAASLGCPSESSGDDEPTGPRVWRCQCAVTEGNPDISDEAEMCSLEDPSGFTGGGGSEPGDSYEYECECTATSRSCNLDGGTD